MTRTRNWTGRATTAAVLTASGMLALGGIAYADTLQDTIADTGTGVNLVAGSSGTGSAAIRVIGNSAAGDPDPGCNIDAGESALKLDIVTPAGVTANPDPMSLTSCGTDFAITFTASSSARSGHVTVTVLSGPAGGGTYVNQVDIPITVTQPAPVNTKPSVTVEGVTGGARYEIGDVPDATCSVSDAEDGNSTVPAAVTGILSHGLGSQTATCDYTDQGGLVADTASVSYRVVDTGAPTINHSLSPSSGPNANGWYKQDVAVLFECDDSGSGIDTCEGDTALGEGGNQSVTGTATDWAGNTTSDTVSGINIDKTGPSVSLSGGPGASYYYGSDPAAPTCEASDALSGLASCVVSGGGTAVGDHTYSATATDNAGNTSTATFGYTVLAWNLKGFYSPVDMNGVWNTVKGGSTVPLKFEAFAGSELTSTSAVSSFTQKSVTCPGGSAITDAIEITSTGGTALRFDSTAGQFIQNWATPKKPGTCWNVTMTTQDGSSLGANFMLK